MQKLQEEITGNVFKDMDVGRDFLNRTLIGKNCPYAEQMELTEKQEDSVPQIPQNGEKSLLS